MVGIGHFYFGLTIHKLIVDLPFPIIYTTNYDHCIECSFEHYKKQYVKIASVADIIKIKNGHTQIVKFHGDFDYNGSIVLDETSYFERLEFETPLDIKFRSDVLGKSVLFIGYSFKDINLRFLFYKLSKLWKANINKKERPKLYMFSHRPNPVQEAVLNQWGIDMIFSEIDDPGNALEDFLIKLSEGVSEKG